MKQNKLEKQLREKLRGREIRPSKEAWNRISERLEASERSETPGQSETLGYSEALGREADLNRTPGPARPKSKVERFQWYGVAAGFIGILFLSILYFSASDAPGVPETKISRATEDSVPLESQKKAGQKPIVEENVLVDNESGDGESIENENLKNRVVVVDEVLVQSDIEIRNQQKVDLPTDASEELLHTKIAEIVAQVQVLENKNDSVSEAEIDSLLRGAQREILADKIFRKDNSVDASALLADVEQELDRSFRDQIFDALKDGFLKVRTAVADRNK